MRPAVPDFDPESLEIYLASEWYLHKGIFDLRRVLDSWCGKLEHALGRGYDGMRVSGNTVWLEKWDWQDFCQYEQEINDFVMQQPMPALYTYALAASGAAEILDVARTHQFVVARRSGNWDMIETPELKQAKQEIQKLNAELEQRVAEWTSQLTAANDELR